MRTRSVLPAALAVAIAVPVTLLPAAAGASTTVATTSAASSSATAAATDDDVTQPVVTELDVTGVDAQALATLPDEVPVPEEDLGSSAASDGSALRLTPDAPVEEADPDVLTAEWATTDFSMFGATWDAAGVTDVVIRYRVHGTDGWSGWEAVGPSDQGLDGSGADTEGSGARDGIDAVVALRSDGIQLWAQAGSGTVRNLSLVLIDVGEDRTEQADPEPTASPAPTAAPSPTPTPTTSATPGTAPSPSPTAAPAPTADAAASTAASTGAQTVDAAWRTTGGATATTAATTTTTGAVLPSAVAPSPTIVTRAQWGADESLVGCRADYSTSMVSAAVHHTASTNDYTAADVPGLLRGFLAYHTRPEAQGGRGWCDIGYNFLVDKFGTIYEGRAGSIDTTVIGVHTGGFNSRTVGVAAIGTFTSTAPSGALAESISQLIAWKFRTLGISASGSVTMTSGGGASKYPAGTVVTFPTIYAHRDAQLTSCPGDQLYSILGSIRARVGQLSDAEVAASPRGSLDRLSGSASGIEVAGWALDPQSSASLQIEVDVDGAVTRLTASGERPDLAAAYPGLGTAHGFTSVVAASGGYHRVCVRAVNVADGWDRLLGCSGVTVTNADPIGSVDTLASTGTGVRVAGWALDPDTSASIEVHVYIDGKGARALVASGSRPDVGAAYGKGDAHGFDAVVPTSQGTHEVCVYAINTPTGSNPVLRCAQVQVGSPPFGSIDTLSVSGTTLTVAGWALDPDTTASIRTHVYIDGAGAASLAADGSRPDVGKLHGKGDAHGYNWTTTLAYGTHQVCVWAIDSAGGTNTQLGCRTVTVRNAAPFGSIDTVAVSGQTLTVAGWALDPDTTASIRTHVYIDGAGAASLAANGSRPDVGRIHGKGDAHGYNWTTTLSVGTHQVCVYAIDAAGGPNTQLGCRTVTVRNVAPLGSIDTVAVSGGTLTVAGWALDPDTTASIRTHIYIDGAGAASILAAGARPDVAQIHGKGAAHGYHWTTAVAAGTHQVCVWAIDTAGGANTLLGCRTVTG
jgi:hypothetical protein